MSIHNIVRKLGTISKYEEIINFYLIFFTCFGTSLAISFGRTVSVCFHEFYFPSVGLFNWGYTGTEFFRYSGINTVSQWRYTRLENLLWTLPYIMYFLVSFIVVDLNIILQIFFTKISRQCAMKCLVKTLTMAWSLCLKGKKKN